MAMERGHNVARDVPDDVQNWLREHRLDRHIMTWPSPPPMEGDLHFDPERGDVKQYYVRVPVESLADLKAWIGIPNAPHPKHEQSTSDPATPASRRQASHLPAAGSDGVTVRAAERQVLFEDVDERMIGNAFWGGIISDLLARWCEIEILVLPSLVVPHGAIARFSNTPTAVFDTVTVYGTGSLRFLNDCKLICRTFETVPSKPPTTGGIDTTTT